MSTLTDAVDGQILLFSLHISEARQNLLFRKKEAAFALQIANLKIELLTAKHMQMTKQINMRLKDEVTCITKLCL
jgi:hypothetical protein